MSCSWNELSGPVPGLGSVSKIQLISSSTSHMTAPTLQLAGRMEGATSGSVLWANCRESASGLMLRETGRYEMETLKELKNKDVPDEHLPSWLSEDT